jgi:hypothetical protein
MSSWRFEDTVQTLWGYVHMFVYDTERKSCNDYLIFQGGIPEVEEFIRKFHK